MGFKERLQPYIEDILTTEPPTVGLRNEIVEAIAWAFHWDHWRETQDPVPDDTFANRAQFVKVNVADWLGDQLIAWLATYRRRGFSEGTELD